MSYDSFAWLPLAAGLTILGLVLSYLTYRRRGQREPRDAVIAHIHASQVLSPS